MFELKLIYIIEIIAFLFVVFALLKRHIENFLNIRVCALCAAVSTAWISALLLKNLMIIDVSNTIISIMIGQSIVGIMYSYENYVKEARSTQSLLWLKKLLIIIVGTIFAYYLIETTIFIQLCLILISLLILLIFALWFNKGFDENGKDYNPENNTEIIKEHNAAEESKDSKRIENTAKTSETMQETDNKEEKTSHAQSQNSGIKTALLELEKKFERCCD